MKKVLAVKKRFVQDGKVYIQDCISGQIAVVGRSFVAPTITDTTPKGPYVEIPKFMIERRKKEYGRND